MSLDFSQDIILRVKDAILNDQIVIDLNEPVKLSSIIGDYTSLELGFHKIVFFDVKVKHKIVINRYTNDELPFTFLSHACIKELVIPAETAFTEIEFVFLEPIKILVSPVIVLFHFGPWVYRTPIALVCNELLVKDAIKFPEFTG